MRVLLAGGTGSIGSALLPLLGDHDVRVLTRRQDWSASGVQTVHGDALNPDSLVAATEGIDLVVSALGASVALSRSGRASYADIDVPANRNLIDAARASDVSRFVYVGVHSGAGYENTRYVQAHEEVSTYLNASGLSATTVRPTGVYTALEDFLGMAQRGFASVIGDGSATTNPVDPRDVAAAIFDNLKDGPKDVSVGGPEVLTRRRIAELAFEAIGKTPRVSGVPAVFPRTMAKVIRPFHPRLGDLVEFATAVSIVDAVAPAVGTRTLLDYFRELAGRPLLEA